MRICCAAALLFLLFFVTGPATGADSEAKPFPLRTTIFRDNDATFYVEGTQRIPKGVEISVQKGIKIIGRGSDAVLEVEGSLQVHGVELKKVVFEDVTVTAPPKFEDIQIDHCIFRGTGGVILPEEFPADGKVFVEHTRFHRGTRLEVTMCRGNVDVGSVYSTEPVVIRAMTPEGKTGNNVRVIVRDCSAEGQGALWGGLVIEGANDANVRRNLLGGGEARFEHPRVRERHGLPVASRDSVVRYNEPVPYTRITVDPRRMGGVPCIRDLRMPVATIGALVSEGLTAGEIVTMHPDLVEDDVKEALQYAVEALHERSIPVPGSS